MIERFAAFARAELDRVLAEVAERAPLDAETRRRLDAELTAVRGKLDAVVRAKLAELSGVAGNS
jgi:hypothetical protein